MTALVRTVLVGAIVPLVIASLGVVAILLSIPDLPDPVAIHWNLAGEADGAGPVIVPLLLVGLPPIAFSAIAVLVARPRVGEPFSANQRLLLAAAPFLAGVLAIVLAGSVVIQRGRPSADEAPGIGGVLLTGLLVAFALGLAGWFLLPKSSPRAPAPAVEPAPLGATQKAVWLQRVGPARGTVVVLAIAGVLAAAGTLAMWLLAPLPLAIGFTAVMVLVGMFAAATLDWRVTVGADGLRVRSALGVPEYRIGLADIASVARIEVEPVRDFGGWGIRSGGRRRWGVVAQRGEAIEVRRTDGSSFVVTVPDAGEGAALLASLADRD